jgi:hypothetical protein
MQVDEIRQLVSAMEIPQPPASASDDLKSRWLSLQLLQEIACQLAALNTTHAAEAVKTQEFVALAKEKI